MERKSKWKFTRIKMEGERNWNKSEKPESKKEKEIKETESIKVNVKEKRVEEIMTKRKEGREKRKNVQGRT